MVEKKDEREKINVKIPLTEQQRIEKGENAIPITEGQTILPLQKVLKATEERKAQDILELQPIKPEVTQNGSQTGQQGNQQDSGNSGSADQQKPESNEKQKK